MEKVAEVDTNRRTYCIWYYYLRGYDCDVVDSIKIIKYVVFGKDDTFWSTLALLFLTAPDLN